MSGLELPGATCPLPGSAATARPWRWAPGGAALVAWLAAPMPALGHSLTGRLDSPLPLAVYLGGAAFAVALSFAFALSRTVRVTEPPPGRVMVVPRWLALGLRAIGLVAWLWIVAQAIVGGSSEADVSTLFPGIRTRQLPLAIVMVVLTASTLWSLGQAVVRESDASSSAGVATARLADPGPGPSPRR